MTFYYNNFVLRSVEKRSKDAWQTNNTGFRNPQRIIALLRLLSLIESPLVKIKNNAIWDVKEVANAIENLRYSLSEDDEKFLPSFGTLKIEYSGVQKGLTLAQEWGFVHDPDAIFNNGLVGRSVLTAQGLSLIDADWRAQQWIFARTMALQQVEFGAHGVGNPLLRVSKVLGELKKQGGDPKISIDELAFFVMPQPWNIDAAEIARKIESRRKQASKGKESFKVLFKKEYSNLSLKWDTLRTYAHCCYMAFRSTGLFMRGQMSLRADDIFSVFWEKMYAGKNPFSESTIMAQRKELEQKNGRRKNGQQDDIAILNILADMDGRHAESLMESEETRSNVVKILSNKKDVLTFDGEKYEFQDLSHHTIYEWAVYAALRRIFGSFGGGWRGFYDGSGCPHRHAPGGGCDALIETESVFIGVEATLTSGIGQFKAEASSIVHHAADLNQRSIRAGKKMSFTIFVAPTVDSNIYAHASNMPYLVSGSQRCYAPIIPLTSAQLLLLFNKNLSSEKWLDVFHKIDEKRPYRIGDVSQNSEKVWVEYIDCLVKDC